MTSKENSLENKSSKESLNFKIETMKESLEELKDKETFKSTDLFKIVVESLEKKEIFLPNKKIYAISHMHVGGVKKMFRYILIKFKGEKHNSIIYFNEQNNEVIVKVGGDDTYTLLGRDAEIYRDKYLAYAIRFIKEEGDILKEKSNLGKVRLEKLGI